MTIENNFQIGVTEAGLKSLAEIGIYYDADASYRPFSVVDQLGDLSTQANGFPIAAWHFDAMAPGDADKLYNYLGGKLSTPVFIKTRLNRLNTTYDDYQWGTFSGIMSWSSGDEQVQALHTIDVTITFTGLVSMPPSIRETATATDSSSAVVT